MTVDALIVYGKKYLHKDMVMMLLGSILELNSLELLLHLDLVVSDEKVKEFKNKIKLIQENKPIQYVIGTVNFYGNIFKVNESVLIPRFETEELVENTIKYIKELFDYPIKIIDLGTGSGCIGITLKKKLGNPDVTLLDISEEALSVAKENARLNGVVTDFIHSDMWNQVNNRYDVVISNPPYIKKNEEIEDIVYQNEPHLALYGGEDGLDLYRKIRKNIEKYLQDKYLIALEIGDTQKEDIINIFSDLNQTEIICKKDLAGRDRMIFIYKK